MDFVSMIIFGLIKIALFILSGLLVFNLLETIKVFQRCKKHRGRYPLKKSFKHGFMNYRHFGPLNVIKWIVLDVIRGKSYFKLFGIWCFCGYYGEGKSLGEVNFAFNLKNKHPDMNIKIFSNFNVKGQDGKITKWEDILDLPKNTILLFDEIQSTFTSTKFKDFPLELLWKLTQCRKHGLAIFCTSPVYSRMSIQLRESCDYVIDCKNVFKLDRLFKYTFFRADKYEKFQQSEGILQNLKKSTFIEFIYALVARDLEYSRYNTKEQIDRFDVVEEEKTTSKSKTIDISKIENEVYKKVMNEIEKRGGLRSA